MVFLHQIAVAMFLVDTTDRSLSIVSEIESDWAIVLTDEVRCRPTLST